MRLWARKLILLQIRKIELKENTKMINKSPISKDGYLFKVLFVHCSTKALNWSSDIFYDDILAVNIHIRLTQEIVQSKKFTVQGHHTMLLNRWIFAVSLKKVIICFLSLMLWHLFWGKLLLVDQDTIRRNVKDEC